MAPESRKRIRAHYRGRYRGQDGLTDVKRYGVPYFGRSDAESASTK